MIACDRCKKQASQASVGLPERRLDLCDRCANDLQRIVDAFLASQTFTVTGVVPASVAAADPLEDNVQVKP